MAGTCGARSGPRLVGLGVTVHAPDRSTRVSQHCQTLAVLKRTAGLWGPVAFAVSAVVAARRQPGYSHRRNHVSGLASLGERSAAFMVPGFITLGAAQSVLATPTPALRRMAQASAGTTVAAGLIRVSRPHCPQPGDHDATASDLGHAVASIATFVLWTAMPFVAARGQTDGWYPRFGRAMTLPTVATFLGAGATTRLDSPVKGIAQRAFLASVFVFQAATSLAERPGDAAQPRRRMLGSGSAPHRADATRDGRSRSHVRRM